MRHLLIATVLLLPSAAGAQSDWGRLRELEPHQAVKVHLTDGSVLKGTIQAADADGLAVQTAKESAVQLGKDSIARVTKKSRGRGAMWGAIVGFAAAAPVGAYLGPYVADWGNPSVGVRLRHAAGWGLFFGGVGAGIGTLTGAERTIYKAPRADHKERAGSR